MSKVEIYTWQYCPFVFEQNLSQEKNINFTEYRLMAMKMPEH